MKKVLSLSLALLMLFTSLSVMAFAAKTEEENNYPLIVVPGYSASELYVDYNDGTQQKHIWGVQSGPIIKEVVANLGKLGKSIAKLTVGDKSLLIKTVSDAVRNLYGELALNTEGGSTSENYTVSAALKDPASTTDAAFIETYGKKADSYLNLPEINLYFADNYSGRDNTFNCHVDFRQNSIQCAKELDLYVQAVKAYTGASKVRIYGLSHGGMTVGVFLNLITQGKELAAQYPEFADILQMETTADEIDTAVMFHPALSGAAFLCNFLDGTLEIDEGYITEYAQVGAFSETELEFIMKMVDLKLLDPLANALVDEIFQDIAGNWGSVWDFMIPDRYEEYKADRAAKEPGFENTSLIKKSEIMHNIIMKSYNSAFKEIQDAGVGVAIISGYGRRIVTGYGIISDGILSTTSTSGAKCAEIGKRFADGYKQSGTMCTDSTHNHVSPSMEIDASYSYLPENTWFVRNQLHGQVFWDDYTKVLCGKLLFEKDNIRDIYADKNYPQFEYSQNPKDEVHIAFDEAPTVGNITAASKGVYITNLSKKYSIKLSTVYFQGLTDVTFNVSKVKAIKPCQTVFVPFKGEIPSYNMVRDTLVVSYTQIGSLSPLGVRKFPVTIVSGDDVEYNGEEVNVDMVDPLDNVIKLKGLNKILSFTGLKDFLISFFHMIQQLFAGFKK